MKNGKAFLSELENIYTALMSFFLKKRCWFYILVNIYMWWHYKHDGSGSKCVVNLGEQIFPTMLKSLWLDQHILQLTFSVAFWTDFIICAHTVDVEVHIVRD